MSEFSADVRSRISRDFGARAPNAFQLMAQLAEKIAYVDHASERQRIHRAVVRGADGDLVRMGQLVDLAGIDYRDLLMEVEYDP